MTSFLSGGTPLAGGAGILRAAAQVWEVGALCRAIADALEARFNPVTVRGELAGFSRAGSGHCYFSIKDAQSQLHCAMFRRAASLLDFSPCNGDLVEVRGRLGVYEPRGGLQLIVESMGRAGQGALFEQFLRLKTRLEQEGLFDPDRKRPLPTMPRGIGVVTSLGAAALQDVLSALRRRVPHIPVIVAPAVVQGTEAPAALAHALNALYRLATLTAQPFASREGFHGADGAGMVVVDVILLVRGGGSMEDLWAFNDEALARTVVASPVPVVSGVGHETDFTIADFVADLRAPTPTAAAELVAEPRTVWIGALELLQNQLREAAEHQLDQQAQRLDQSQQRLGRPSSLLARQQVVLGHYAQLLRYAARTTMQTRHSRLAQVGDAVSGQTRLAMQRTHDRLERAGLHLELLDPALVLRRGYAWLTDASGHVVTHASDTRVGQDLRATLADGEVDLMVTSRRLI